MIILPASLYAIHLNDGCLSMRYSITEIKLSVHGVFTRHVAECHGPMVHIFISGVRRTKYLSRSLLISSPSYSTLYGSNQRRNNHEHPQACNKAIPKQYSKSLCLSIIKAFPSPARTCTCVRVISCAFVGGPAHSILSSGTHVSQQVMAPSSPLALVLYLAIIIHVYALSPEFIACQTQKAAGLSPLLSCPSGTIYVSSNVSDPFAHFHTVQSAILSL